MDMRKINAGMLRTGDTIECHGILEAVQVSTDLKMQGIMTDRHRGLRKDQYVLVVTSVKEEKG